MLRQLHANRQDDERACAKHIREWLESTTSARLFHAAPSLTRTGRVAALIAECSAICVWGRGVIEHSLSGAVERAVSEGWSGYRPGLRLIRISTTPATTVAGTKAGMCTLRPAW